MNSKTLTALAACLFLLVSFSVAQGDNNAAITGIITDSETNAPIPGVSIRIEGTRLGAQTNIEGRFTIDSLEPGNYTLVVTSVGYGTLRMILDLAANQTLDLAMSLDPSVADIGKEIIVSGTADVIDRYTTESKFTPQADKGATVGIPKVADQQRGLVYSNPGGGNYLDQSDKKARMPREKPNIYPVNPSRWEETENAPYDMFFRNYGTHDFVDTRRDRFSTFAVDIDDASYNVAKEYLERGYLPPADAIRVEEFVNHFDYGYNPPDKKKFRVFSEMTPSIFSDGTTILKIGIKGAEIERSERRPVNLTFVIDVSGSMRQENRLELVKQAMIMLVRQLRPSDRIAIVAYGSSARVVLEPTDMSNPSIITRAISTLYAGGSTYAEAGLKLGYELANRSFDSESINRVILCSDGVANVGQTNPDAIMRDIKRFADRGIVLSTFGVGMGNYNDVLLERLAMQGNGRYAYINDFEEARRMMVTEFVGNLEILARDVKVQVEFNPDRVSSYRLLGYENRDVADNKFRDNRQDGGEIGSGHEVTVLYELVMNDRFRSGGVATVHVRWIDPDQTEVTELTQEVEAKGSRWSVFSSRPELRLAVVASRFAEMLKNTEYASETSWNELRRAAEPLAHQMHDDETRELLDLIDRARELSVYHTDLWNE